jgi:hypothetical protein
MAASEQPGESKPPRIRVGRVESVDLFEIKDSELEIFERGSPADLQLNFAIFLLSMAVTALAALFTGKFPDSTTHTAFIVLAVVGIIVGVYLLIAWLINRASSKSICTRIRERIKETSITTKIEATEQGTHSVETTEPKE